MNTHHHRVIFNKQRNCMMVVSEVASSTGKSKSGKSTKSRSNRCQHHESPISSTSKLNLVYFYPLKTAITQSIRAQAATNYIAFGFGVNITATGAGVDSNVLIQGSTIKAVNDAALTADNGIDLLAAKNTASSLSTNSASSSSIGVSISSQSGVGITFSASRGRGNADGNDTSFTNTQIAADNTASITSGGDTSLKGAVVAANQIKADIGGNLNIESLQDTSTYTSRQQSAGGSITFSPAGVPTGASISASRSNTNSNFQSVNEQSGLKAGDGGFQVNAGGNTHLRGSVIASTQTAVDANKNTFTTGGALSITDLQNVASFKASGVSVGVSVGMLSPGSPLTPGGSAGFGSAGGNASSTSSAGISGIAGNTAARTGDANTGLQQIFDADKVQREINAQVAITAAFSKEAPKAVATFSANQMADLKKDLAKETDPDKQAAIKAEMVRWDEGGRYRVLLHTLAGAFSGGASGALGAAASASAAPLMNQLQDGIASGLQTAGLSADVAKGIASSVAGLTAAGAGAAVGGTAGAATAFTVDVNNRQLHPTEVQRIKELAGSDVQKQVRLTQAACALVRCADGVPKDDANYAYLKSMQDAGASLTEEKALLSQQQGQQGRIYGQLFQYTGVDQYLIDPATQNKLGTRLVGAMQVGAGIAGVAGSGALCTTGIGCVAGAVTGTVSADYAQAGAKQAITGSTTQGYGEQVLQSLGLSPQAAALTYAALGIAPAAMGAVALNKTANAQAALNADARLSYISIEKFGAQGVQPTASVMQTPQAQAIVAEYLAAGVPAVIAIRRTGELIKTGVNLPTPITIGQGEELFKVVPKNYSVLGSDGVTPYTPFFMTRKEFNSLSQLSNNQIAQRLGLPAEQGVRGSQIGFDVYAMKPISGTTPTVFVSEVAPVQQAGYSATGGAQQVLVPNRTLWTNPNSNKIGTISGGN